MVIATREDIAELYRKRAERYDLTANLYYFIGFREWAYRKRAVEALQLRPGDSIVEVGCGTGLNFSLFQRHIGPSGRIIGVDLTDAMLAQARRRVEAKGWSNVELVQSDAAAFEFPEQVDGIISTFAITLMPEFDAIIKSGSEALRPGKRWVILDFKMPANWLSRLAPLLILLVRPFGGTLEMTERHPWESLQRHLDDTSLEDLYLGMVYIASGAKGGRRSRHVRQHNQNRGNG